MSLGRLTGSHDSVPRAPATRWSGDFAARRQAHAPMTNSTQAHLPRAQNWPARHEEEPQEGAAGRADDDVAAADACIGRPRFARLHASIAERQLDWGWQQCPDAARLSDERERSEAGHAGTGFSARAVWLGGIAFVLLAAGIISALATVQSSRPLPFEIWARGDLMQRAGAMPGAMPGSAVLPGRSAGAPDDALMGSAGPDPIAALVEPVAARAEPAATPASASAEREAGEVDAALASDARLEPAEIEVAVLGPILASAATAEKLVADLALAPTAGVRTRAGRLFPEPPRPVLKPTLVSSLQREPDETARPAPRP
jgi:hypothetical protein